MMTRAAFYDTTRSGIFYAIVVYIVKADRFRFRKGE